ncbi:MAG TPA: serine protease [bacterium]|nr:serine protease [bacterium]
MKLSKPRTHLLPTYVVLLALALCPIPSAAQDGLRKSVVKIFTTMQNPNYYEPWRVDGQENVSGSGCVIAGHRILTNAHVVSNQIFIQVLKDGDSRKYTAKVEFVAHDCDLALLKVEDSRFFKGTKPVKYGTLPYLRDNVQVYGYPVGGEELSITQGVVSRIELIPYSHSMRNLLGVQTDAAINPGNSGGPVFDRHKKLVGVAFQGYNAIMAQNTGYFIPIMLVQRFLKEIKRGKYTSIPTLGIYTQYMENETLRESFGMGPNQTGILVSKILYGSSAWGTLKENDVVLSIGGYPIANDGTIAFRRGERLNFQYPLGLRRIGDELSMKILRGDKTLNLKVTLKGETRLVPLVKYDQNPTYFIFGGLIFTPFTTNYLQTIKDNPSELLRLYYDGLPSPGLKQVVLMSHILSHEINKGYDTGYANLVITKINGKPISEMKDVIAAFEKPVSGRHVIEFDKAKEVGTRIVIDAAKAKRATEEILQLNNIPSDRSADLK